MLEGKKTYIVAIVIGLATMAQHLGWLSAQQFETIVGILGALGLATLRSGVAKSGPQT